MYSTFFGGTGIEELRGMAFDAKGNVIVTGYTLSTDLPVTADAVQASNAGNGDAFVAIFNPSLSYTNGLLFSTYFGGSHGEVGYQVAGDAAGNIYLAGYTLSPDLPIAGTVPQAEWGKGTNLFVAKFNTGIGGRGAYQYSTYLGATGNLHSDRAGGRRRRDGLHDGVRQHRTAGDGNAVQGGFAGSASDGFIAVLK